MRTYKGTTVKVGGVLELKVQMWTEHNHSTIFDEMGRCLFDGYSLEAYKRFDEAVGEIIKNANACGLGYEIITK